MAEDKEYEPYSDVERLKPTPMSRAIGHGCAVPAVMLKRASGPRWKQFSSEPALCAVVTVKDASWVAPFVSAARALGGWHTIVEGDDPAKTRDKVLREGLARLASGDRLLAILPASVPLPPELQQASDMILDLSTVLAADIAKAIKLTTQGRARNVRQAIPAEVDLLHAMRAIRSGSTPALCLRRLAVKAPGEAQDPFVMKAPPLEQLHGYGAAMEWAQRLRRDLDAWREGCIDFQAIQRNAVLAGVPGCGKSTFVRSLARSTGLPLVSTSIGQMFASSAGYLDSIVKAIDQLFAEARSKKGGCIVFIDELEGFPDRSKLHGREGSWWTPVVNHMLTVLDGALSNTSDGLVVVGSTNHPDRLDSALVRPGRLDRILWIDLPDEAALIGIYRQHLGDDLIAADLGPVAAAAVGSTGAVAAGHVKGARARARSEGRELCVQDLIDEIVPPPDMQEDDLWRACIHEAGHAISCIVLDVATVKSVAVTGGSSGTGGRLVSEPRRGIILDEKSTLARVVQILAGRAAEEFVLGWPSAGAGGGMDSDLAKASSLVAASHLSLGLRGQLVHAANPDEALMAARRSLLLMQSIELDLQDRYAEAKAIVAKHIDAVMLLAARLKADRVLTGRQLQSILPQLHKGERSDA